MARCSPSLDTALAGELYQQTDGYPFYLDDLIAALHGGAELESTATSPVPTARSERYERFVGRTRLAWNALDTDAQAVAIQLAVLPQPLPTPALQDLCNMGPAGWAATIERLRRARILSSIVNGNPVVSPDPQTGRPRSAWRNRTQPNSMMPRCRRSTRLRQRPLYAPGTDRQHRTPCRGLPTAAC